MQVLVWNLFHGRSLPPSRDGLKDRFAELLSSWPWDAALLQEVPPWWPKPLANATAAHACTALTSRNAGLALRRVVSERRPELLKSNGGGSNAVLARGQIAACGSLSLRLWPERRVAQLVHLADGSRLVNYHASSRAGPAQEELSRLCRRALDWADGAPLLLGGDLNLRSPAVPAGALVHVASRDVDHLFARGYGPQTRFALLDRSLTHRGRRIELSDHVPILAELAPAPGAAAHTSR